MREIKFRAKRKDSSYHPECPQWIYGSLTVIKDRCFILSDIPFPLSCCALAPLGEGRGIDEIIAGYIEVIPSTIGQFTGLCDMNDTKIWEGDKICEKYEIYSGNGNIELIEHIRIVVWDGDFAEWAVQENTSQFSLDGERAKNCEVISNIHEEAKNA